MAYVPSNSATFAPVHDPGYFDVPICNQFSNQPPPRDPTQSISNYDLNQAINLTINDNKESYRVYQTPTRPSASLMTESNDSMTGYYGPHKNQLRKKKELQTVVYDTEHFTGRSAQDDYTYLTNPPMAIDNRMMAPTSTYQQTMYGQGGSAQDFLNFQSIPNIAGLQWQSPVQPPVVNPYSPAHSYKICPCCTRPYNMQANVPPCATCPFARKGAMCPMMMKQMNQRRKVEEYESDSDDDDSDDEEEPVQKKKSSKKDKKEKQTDTKKKPNAVSSLFFIALIVLLIAIFFFLYKFSVEKKMRF